MSETDEENAGGGTGGGGSGGRMRLLRRQLSTVWIPLDDTSPLSVFLVKSGASGDKLLFRYPYNQSMEGDAAPDPPPAEYTNNNTRDRNPSGPASSVHSTEDKSMTESTHRQPGADVFSIIEESGSCVDARHVYPNHHEEPHIQTVVKLSNKVISDLFAVRSSLCDQKFEVKINDIRFVGHPVRVSGTRCNNGNNNNHKNNTNTNHENQEKETDDDDLLTINVVFALRANANHDIAACYHECSQRIIVGLLFEEQRTGYLNKESKLMLSYHDEETGSCDFAEIQRKSRLARTLVKVFEDLTDFGATHLTVNRWMSISFCLPQKVHRLALRHHTGIPSIGPARIMKCLENLRPYHGVVLIGDDIESLQNSLPQDSSPAFFRVIRCISPVKNLLDLSADADISLSQVFHVVAQLLYWGKATVIYPLCENNKYTVHPLAPTSLQSRLAKDFSQQFKGFNLISVLSAFSFGITLKELKKTAADEKQMLAQVIWLLKHRLLLQIHCYVYFVPPELQDRRKYLDPHTTLAVMKDTKSSSIMSAIDSTFTGDRSGETTALQSYTAQDIQVVVSGTKDARDRVLFERLARKNYFDGKRHLEDIMYFEDVTRNELTSLLDKLSSVLYCCEHDDTAMTQLCPYNPYS